MMTLVGVQAFLSGTHFADDKANGEILVFDRTSDGIFHGHVRSFKDLTSQQQNVLRRSGLVDKKGDF